MFKTKGAFTLFELVLVTFLLGIVYALILGSGFNLSATQKKDQPSIFLGKDEYKLILYDGCSKVVRYLYEGNLTKENVEIPFEDVKAYDLRDFEVKEYKDMLIEDELYDVCLVLERNENKTIKPLLLHVNAKYYFISPYESEFQSFNSLEEVKNFADVKSYMPYSKGSYYNE